MAFHTGLVSRRQPGPSDLSHSFPAGYPLLPPSSRSPEDAVLRTRITDLQRKISILTIKTGELPALKSHAEKEERRASNLARMLDAILVAIADEENKTQLLNEQISQLQFLLSRKQEIIDTKDGVIRKLHSEYPVLQAEYESALETFTDRMCKPTIDDENELFSDQTPPVSNRPQPVEELSIIDQTPPVSNRAQPVSNRPQPVSNRPQPSSNRPQPVSNRPQPVSNRSQPVEKHPILDYPAPIGEHSQPIVDRPALEQIDPPWVKGAPNLPIFTRPVHPALQDNIRFNDDLSGPSPETALETNGLTAEQIRAELFSLQMQRNQLESELTRSPPKNVTHAEAKRMRLQLSDQLQIVVQNLNRLRLEIRRQTMP
jgi:hypothetical protein